MWTLVVAIFLSGLLGVSLAPWLARKGVQTHCTSFAAGVLLAVILAHVVPETVEIAVRVHDVAHGDHSHGRGQTIAGTLMLAGFILMMVLQQKVLKADPCCGHEHAKHAGLPSYLALVACSMNDGLILSSTPRIDNPLFWGMCGHKITASFALVMLLRETSAGLSTTMRNLYMLVFISITPAVATLTGQLAFLKGYMHYPVGLGAGALLYVIGGGMIPIVEHSARDGEKKWILAIFLLGAIAMLTLEILSPHQH